MSKKQINTLFNFSIFILIVIAISSGLRLIQRTSSEKEVSELIVERSTEAYETPEPMDVAAEQTDGLYGFKPNKNSEYLAINSDYVGWLTITDTAINYPIVRGSNNDFYLNKDIYKNNSDAGAIFMDYRNIGQFKDQHTIIYGHYMKNGTMFGGLHKYKEEDYFLSNDTIVVSGLYGEKTYTVFSVYIVSADDYMLDIDFNRVDYEDYVNGLESYSIHKKDFIFSEDKALLTLATCSYEFDNGRMIIHAFEN